MRYSSKIEYKDITVGQKWTDGVGTIEIIKIKVPSGMGETFKDGDVLIAVRMVPPVNSKYVKTMNAVEFKGFIHSFKDRLAPIDVSGKIKEKDSLIFKNRFDNISTD